MPCNPATAPAPAIAPVPEPAAHDTARGPAGSAAVATRLRALAQCTSGISIVEFAMILPLFLAAGLMGVEAARLVMTNMRISDIAVASADNASRIGQTDNSAVTPTVSEADIDSVLRGAAEQGADIDLFTNGRLILSSLERDATTGRQFIRWQRCRGQLDVDSRYGPQGYGLTGDAITGIGRPGAVVSAPAGQAVMVIYSYQPLFDGRLTDGLIFREEAAFLVRDDRNLTGNNGTGVTGSAANRCD